MPEIKEPLKSKNQTGRRMYQLIHRYAKDLSKIFITKNGKKVPLSKLDLKDFYSYVKNLPYKRDEKPIEVVGRPQRILTEFKGIDCKKKSVLMGSWAKLNKQPFRLVAMSNRPDKNCHHVLTQFLKNKAWLNADATYSNNKLWEPKNVTHWEVLKK